MLFENKLTRVNKKVFVKNICENSLICFMSLNQTIYGNILLFTDQNRISFDNPTFDFYNVYGVL